MHSEYWPHIIIDPSDRLKEENIIKNHFNLFELDDDTCIPKSRNHLEPGPGTEKMCVTRSLNVFSHTGVAKSG